MTPMREALVLHELNDVLFFGIERAHGGADVFLDRVILAERHDAPVMAGKRAVLGGRVSRQLCRRRASNTPSSPDRSTSMVGPDSAFVFFSPQRKMTKELGVAATGSMVLRLAMVEAKAGLTAFRRF